MTDVNTTQVTTQKGTDLSKFKGPNVKLLAQADTLPIAYHDVMSTRLTRPVDTVDP